MDRNSQHRFALPFAIKPLQTVSGYYRQLDRNSATLYSKVHYCRPHTTFSFTLLPQNTRSQRYFLIPNYLDPCLWSLQLRLSIIPACNSCCYTSTQNTCTRLVQLASRGRHKYTLSPVVADNSSRGQQWSRQMILRTSRKKLMLISTQVTICILFFMMMLLLLLIWWWWRW